MPGLSFRPWKAAKVESGESRQTIRRVRRYPIEVGQTLYHWQQQRTPYRRRLGESVCTAVTPIAIQGGLILLDGEPLSMNEARELAIADGFNTLESFVKFFEDGYGLPFDGVVIQWDELTKPLAEPVAVGVGRVQLPLAEVV